MEEEKEKQQTEGDARSKGKDTEALRQKSPRKRAFVLLWRRA